MILLGKGIITSWLTNMKGEHLIRISNNGEEEIQGKKYESEAALEIMKLPEIIVGYERSEILLSILFKGYDNDWGGHKHELVSEVDDFFVENPLDKTGIDFLRQIGALNDDGVDEEALYEMALTMDHPERIIMVNEFILKNKDYIQNPENVREKLIEELHKLDASLPSSLKSHFRQAISEDMQKRNDKIKETERQISELIDFFKPDPATTKIQLIKILPTDFLYPEQSGTAFEFGNMTILRTHIDNNENLEHEFLHCIINPVVEKLAEKLSDKQKNKISEMGSYRLKIEEGYGNGYFSLLCEEFIRTYNEVIQKNQKPLSYLNFMEKINEISDEKFQVALKSDEALKRRCDQLDVCTLDDLKNNSKKYYDRFGDGELRSVVYEFYQAYIKEKSQNERISFERFALDELENFI